MADASTVVASSTLISHYSSGSSIAAAGFSVSTDIATGLTSTNMKKWPRADITLILTQDSTTSSTAMTVPLFYRALNIDAGTADEAIPTSLTQAHYAGTFLLEKTATGTQYMTILDLQLPGTVDCEFYISNALTNRIAAGWKLLVTPKTDVGATA